MDEETGLVADKKEKVSFLLLICLLIFVLRS